MSDPSDSTDDAGDDAIDVDAQTDGGAGAVSIDGQDVPLELSDDIVTAVENEPDVDLDDIMNAARPPGDAEFSLQAQSNGGDGATIPVQDVHDYNLSSASKTQTSRYGFIQDKQIQKLEKNSVRYTEKVGDWILSRDDLVPGVKERMKALIVGEEGLSVDPSDPDSDADQRLAEHLETIYEQDVRPTKVIDKILIENLKNARGVLRSTDLQPLDLDTLTYIRDGVTGDEIYYQNPTTVQTFQLDADADDQDFDIQSEKINGQALVIGEQVFDVSLYDTPPLEAVADTVVNKKVMQRLKARKAEITSFGAVYAKVNPPEYLPEDEYFDYVEGPDGDQVTKLERALNQNLDAAFNTLKDFQSGTVMSVPMHWELEQLQVPEGTEPMDDQIRGYNKDIARRLLIPFDLIELREGAELSRDTLFRTLMTTIRGWRQEILRVFDQFADVQKDIHGVDGSVDHTFPELDDTNPEVITQLLNFAGLAGLTEKEVRQLMNKAGADLTIDDDMDDLPEPGGPADPGDRQDAMTDFMDDLDGDDVPSSRREAMERGWSPTADIETSDLAAQDDRQFEATIFRVVAPDDDADRYADPVLGIGVDFPNSDVYVDWRNEVFPDQLDEPHVSIYGSVDDLEQATGNIVEPMDTLGVEAAKAVVDSPDSAAVVDVAAQSMDDWDADRIAQWWDDVGGEMGACIDTMAPEVGEDQAARMCNVAKQRVEGGDVDADRAEAAHAFSGFESLREAAHYVRRTVEDQTPNGYTVEVTHPSGQRATVVVHDTDGNFDGSVTVKRSSTSEDEWMVVGTARFFDTLDGDSDFRRVDAADVEDVGDDESDDGGLFSRFQRG